MATPVEAGAPRLVLVGYSKGAPDILEAVVAYPEIRRRVAAVVSAAARIDARNDSQVIFYDQVIPGSTLVGYINADHWALAVPVARTHSTIGSMFVTQNAYPREALVEVLLRFVEEDLSAAP
jgi:hypothetical protein